MSTGIVTKEEIEASKQVEVKVIDKDLYESAKACVEIHKLVTGKKPQRTAMDMVRLAQQIDEHGSKSSC